MIDWSTWNGTLCGYWFLVEEERRVNATTIEQWLIEDHSYTWGMACVLVNEFMDETVKLKTAGVNNQDIARKLHKRVTDADKHYGTCGQTPWSDS